LFINIIIVVGVVEVGVTAEFIINIIFIQFIQFVHRKTMKMVIKFINLVIIIRAMLFTNITVVNSLMVVATTDFILKLVISHGSAHH
jgi:hypothetical protein